MGRQQASKVYKTKRTTKAPDAILHADLASPEALAARKQQKFDEYLPGLGQHYCVPCAKYYESAVALQTHTKSKVHRRQLKALRDGPYTLEEGVAAGGRDVQKFLESREAQNALLQAPQVVGEIGRKRDTAHLKQRRDAGMDVEEPAQPQDAPEGAPQTPPAEAPEQSEAADVAV